MSPATIEDIRAVPTPCAGRRGGLRSAPKGAQAQCGNVRSAIRAKGNAILEQLAEPRGQAAKHCSQQPQRTQVGHRFPWEPARGALCPSGVTVASAAIGWNEQQIRSEPHPRPAPFDQGGAPVVAKANYAELACRSRAGGHTQTETHHVPGWGPWALEASRDPVLMQSDATPLPNLLPQPSFLVGKARPCSAESVGPEASDKPDDHQTLQDAAAQLLPVKVRLPPACEFPPMRCLDPEIPARLPVNTASQARAQATDPTHPAWRTVSSFLTEDSSAAAVRMEL